MVQKESGIFNNNDVEKPYSPGFSDPELIYSSHKTRLYRLKLRGKYFMAKTHVGLKGENHDILSKELELLSGCSHPNIVHVFTLEEETPVGKALIMEYIEGRNLLDFLAEKPSEKDRERLIDQLLNTVHYLHSKGIIHNDLKPENLLVCYSDNSLRLIDFDLADDPSHYLLKCCGCTPEFAAPELKNNHFSDERSDIYSIGRLIELICGKRYGKIVGKCLADNPENRFQDVATLNSRWNTRKSGSFIPYIAGACFLIIGFFLLAFLGNPKNESPKEPPLTIVTETRSEKEPKVKSEVPQPENMNKGNKEKKENIPAISKKNEPELSNPSDQIFKKLNEFNNSTLDKTIRDIRLNRYQEFAHLLIQKFQEEILSNYESYLNLDNISDEELKQEIKRHQLVFLSDKGEILNNELLKLPTLYSYKEEMPKEEFESYIELIRNNKTIY